MFTSHGTFSPEQLIIPMLILLLGLSFWGWMFRDMLRNDDLTAPAKEQWTFAFILLNIFAAVFYYGAIYRNRR